MLTNSICLDANVFVSALVPGEKFHSESLILLQRILHSDIDLYEPEVVMFEVNHALYRKFFQNEIRESDMTEFIDHFYRLPILFQWRENLVNATARLAQQLNFPGIADCSYLAVAQARHTFLVTWDDELIRKGKSVYKNIIRVDQLLDSFISN